MNIDAIDLNTLEISSSISTSNREHRLERDLCYYCGSSEHWIADCPRSRQTPGSSLSSSRPPRTKQTARCSRGGYSY
jgi:hypothetical protein